jgi:hypothetical protein
LNFLYIARAGIHFRPLCFIGEGRSPCCLAALHRSAMHVSSRIQPPRLCENAHPVPAAANGTGGSRVARIKGTGSNEKAGARGGPASERFRHRHLQSLAKRCLISGRVDALRC